MDQKNSTQKEKIEEEKPQTCRRNEDTQRRAYGVFDNIVE